MVAFLVICISMSCLLWSCGPKEKVYTKPTPPRKNYEFVQTPQGHWAIHNNFRRDLENFCVDRPDRHGNFTVIGVDDKGLMRLLGTKDINTVKSYRLRFDGKNQFFSLFQELIKICNSY